MTKTFFTIIFLLVVTTTNAQFKSVDLEAGLGVGRIESNSPNLTTIHTNALIGIEPVFWENIKFNFSFTYSKKVESFLPESRSGKYYPSFLGTAITVSYFSKINETIFFNAGAGPLILRDAVFENEINWDFALLMEGSLDFVISEYQSSQTLIGIKGQFSSAFTNRRPSFTSIMATFKYSFLL